MLNDTQLTLQEVSDEYREFINKFKSKKTTDDCYTPDNVYDAVLDWVISEYGIDKNNIVRPFWPGGDYEREHYPEWCTVVDNPPFSIISAICKRYQENGIKFFLFAPYLTNFSSQIKGCTHIIVDVDVMYENGATVNTSFITNLQPGCEIRTAPTLRNAIFEADRQNRKEKKRELPKYSYPPNVVTATMIGYLSKYGQNIQIASEDCFFIRALDAQKAKGKCLFGSGYLISEKAAAEKAAAEKAAAEKAAAEKAAAEKAAAEKAAAEKWQLSEREKTIIKLLDKHGFNPYQE